MNSKEKTKQDKELEKGTDISRRDAIRKMGYAAFAASTMFLLLNNPTKVHAQSPAPADEDPWDGWG